MQSESQKYTTVNALKHEIFDFFRKRATILLFFPTAEKLVTGAFIKIVKFSKYITAQIIYEGIARVETYEYPKDAVREALLNAVTHKDYSGATPIQISVYDDEIILWNEEQLSENWTVENLFKKHPTKPHNPDIANEFFRYGFIELWGRGTLKITRKCELAGQQKPVYKYSMSGIFVEHRRDIINIEYLKTLNLNKRQIDALLFFKAKGEILSSE